MTKLFWITT